MLPLQTYHTFYPGSPSLRAGPSTKMLFHFTFREKYSSSFATHSMTPFLTTVPQPCLSAGSGVNPAFALRSCVTWASYCFSFLIYIMAVV